MILWGKTQSIGNDRLLYRLTNTCETLVSSNYLLNHKLLSEDSWQVYELSQNKKLGKVNQLLKINS
jgi:hypothetical protein